jgi:GTP cyclohydrolase I
MSRGESYMSFPEDEADRRQHGEDLIKRFLLNETSPDEEVLDNTPRRFAEAFRELMGAYDESSKFTTFPSTCDEMVVVKDISFVTLCAHHLLPFMGHAHVGYIPTGRIAGLSKIARAVRGQARGLWAQEDLTMKIADVLEEVLQPKGVAVVMEAEHTCMAIRGVKADGSKTTTSAMRGAFREKDNNARLEFLGLIR